MTKKIRSINFPGLSKFNGASEGPQNGGKMTGMDLLEFRDINGPDPMPKYGAIWSIGCLVWISPCPSIFRVKGTNFLFLLSIISLILALILSRP